MPKELILVMVGPFIGLFWGFLLGWFNGRMYECNQQTKQLNTQRRKSEEFIGRIG